MSSISANSGKPASLQPASLFLSKPVLAAAALLLLLAAWAGQHVIVILLALGLSAAGLSLLWSRLCLKGLQAERRLSEHRLFPGESLELKLRVVNRKPLPLAWVEISDQLPAQFGLEGQVRENTRPGYLSLSQTLPLLWYSAAAWRYRLTAERRGYYPLGPLSLSSGDIFGLYPRTLTYPGGEALIVYPRVFDLPQPALRSLFPVGEARAERRIFEDPARTVGVRDYRPGDSLKRIHWKASARQNELQVRVFEPSTTLKAEIFLVLDSFQFQGIWQAADLELGISAAASLANLLLSRRCQVGLSLNSRLADSGQSARLPAAGGDAQLQQILEALAKLTASLAEPFSNYFLTQKESLPPGATLCFICREIPENLPSIFPELRRQRYKLALFQIAAPAELERLEDVDLFQIAGSLDSANLDVREVV